jgi:hypothetical protein
VFFFSVIGCAGFGQELPEFLPSDNGSKLSMAAVAGIARGTNIRLAQFELRASHSGTLKFIA